MDYDKIDLSLEIIEEGNEMMVSDSTEKMYEGEDIVTESEEGERNPAIYECYNSDFGSRQEQVIKKMMAAAKIACHPDASPEEVASQVDEAVVRTKTAYKVSTGELDITESTDVLIDQAAARLNTFIQKKLNMQSIAEKAVDVVALAFPPVAKVKPLVRLLAKKADPHVRKAIKTGINNVASYAKKAVKGISEAVKVTAKIAKWLLS